MVVLWTEERDEEMRRLKRLNHSAGEIAAALGDGLTRNAVLGRLHRLGIKEGKVVKKRVAPRNPQAKKPVRKSRPQQPSRVIIFHRPKRESSEVMLPPRKAKSRIVCTEADSSLASTPLNVRMMDLTPDACRWPVNEPEPKGEYLFCGHPKKYGPYCAHHAAMSVGLGTFAEAMADKLGWAA